MLIVTYFTFVSSVTFVSFLHSNSFAESSAPFILSHILFYLIASLGPGISELSVRKNTTTGQRNTEPPSVSQWHPKLGLSVVEDTGTVNCHGFFVVKLKLRSNRSIPNGLGASEVITIRQVHLALLEAVEQISPEVDSPNTKLVTSKQRRQWRNSEGPVLVLVNFSRCLVLFPLTNHYVMAYHHQEWIHRLNSAFVSDTAVLAMWLLLCWLHCWVIKLLPREGTLGDKLQQLDELG